MKDLLFEIEKLLNQPNLLFNSYQDIWRVVISGILFYFFLIIVLNISGKRSITNLSMYDYIVTLALGSLVSSAIILKSVSFMDGVVGVLILLALQFLITYLTRFNVGLFRFLNPAPSVLFYKGTFVEENLRKNRATKDEVYAAIRSQGQTTSDQIFAVVLESNGNLSVIKSASEEYAHEITRYL
ncbi:DUF421 domain-containing protein [Facklamia miroungae]|uniref:DUF421 domain-containing protein n=1 Tax=Facklamia miroungae TaxID=120956 RepID=A0A1G7QCM7_9LACT|nr:YetF domain-containing protein [Facklamia miroungae]NKZ28900.1 DUF421 domain-containing protein [Facklamia miroungae]SDF96244.1 Protein of unknown function [Facklamia miroungae]